MKGEGGSDAQEVKDKGESEGRRGEFVSVPREKDGFLPSTAWNTVGRLCVNKHFKGGMCD